MLLKHSTFIFFYKEKKPVSTYNVNQLRKLEEVFKISTIELPNILLFATHRNQRGQIFRL